MADGRILERAWTRKMPLRLVGVALSNLSGPSRQLDLFRGESRSRSVGSAIDAVRARFGYDAIRLGASGHSRWLEQRPGSPDSSPEEDDDTRPEEKE